MASAVSTGSSVARLVRCRPESRERGFLSERALGTLLQIASPIVALLIWEALVDVRLLDSRFFPAPSSLVGTLFKLLRNGELYRHVEISLQRVAAGFVLGAVPGIVIGLAMGLSKWVRYSLYPIVASLYPIPKIAILPLVIIIFGIGETSKIIVIATGVFFVVLYNSMGGVLGIPQIYHDVGSNFGAKRLFYYRTIALPGALPYIFTGLKLGAGVSLLVLVAAEFVGAKAGIGFMVWDAWQSFAVEQLFIGLAAIALLGFAFGQLLDQLQRWLVPWHY